MKRPAYKMPDAWTVFCMTFSCLQTTVSRCFKLDRKNDPSTVVLMSVLEKIPMGQTRTKMEVRNSETAALLPFSIQWVLHGVQRLKVFRQVLQALGRADEGIDTGSCTQQPT